MKSSNELRTLLRSIDHKGYPAYKSLAGVWQFPAYTLVIDHVQGDPFASPSALHVEIPMARAGFPAAYYEKDCMRIALQDYLTRQLARQFEAFNFKAKGSGKSGLLSITRCGQEVLERSACGIAVRKPAAASRTAASGTAGSSALTETLPASMVAESPIPYGSGGTLTARFHVGFPAFGRTINAGELEKILFEFLPRCVESSLFFQRLDARKVKETVQLAEDQDALRRLLKENGFVCFVANGSVLPRKSGVSDLPMKDSVPFVSPASMEQTFSLPNRGSITGMAVPAGITLIVGGGYHGKSTLLEAIQSGVYNHIAGDGREFVITDDTAVKLRAEDGRCVRNVDISLFINDLPNGRDTRSFTTEDASGSTSQAASLVESIEAGSRLFLIDEDTSATNFMVRDDFMQQVISRKKEPITPFIERVGDLYRKAGVSTIMVAGSSGAFFFAADHILQMDCYHTLDITETVKNLCSGRPAPRMQAADFALPDFARALPPYRGKDSGRANSRGGDHHGHDSSHGGNFHGRGRENNSKYEHMKVKSSALESFSLDRETVNVRYLEQLTDPEQVTALAHLLRFCLEEVQDGKKTVQETVQIVFDTLNRQGFDAFCGSYVPCGLAKPRVQEFFACVNRFRG